VVARITEARMAFLDLDADDTVEVGAHAAPSRAVDLEPMKAPPAIGVPAVSVPNIDLG
jgi:hypothetical protein